MEPSVRHFGFSRSSGLAPGRVYLDDASFSPSTLENSVFKKHRFQIAPLWRAFSNDSVFGDRFWRCSVDGSRIQSKTGPFSFENGFVWTGPKVGQKLLVSFYSKISFHFKEICKLPKSVQIVI